MLISELEEILKRTRQEHGDLEVLVPEGDELVDVAGVGMGENEKGEIAEVTICGRDMLDAFHETADS